MIFSSENKKEEMLGLLLIFLGIFLRLMPHPDNFNPVTAIALFSGVVLSAPLALSVPILIMIASDIVLGPHSLTLLTWGCFLAVTLMGMGVRRSPKMPAIFLGTLGGSVLFFVVTNLGVFFFDKLYPMNQAGFVECFVMAIPFFKNTLLGDLFYSFMFFGLFALAKTLVKHPSRA